MSGIFDPGIFDSGIFDSDAGLGGGAGPAYPKIWINGDPDTTIIFDNHQLNDLSFGLAAFDASIGQGQITVPGTIPWTTGTRLTWFEGTDLLYTGYLHSPSVRANPARPLENETTYRLMDVNRQFFGRRVTDQAFPLDYSLDELVAAIPVLIEGAGAPNPTLDDTTYVDTGASDIFPAKTYNSDGATDWIADIIAYTGKTVYLNVTQTENTFYLHVHSLTTGGSAGISISDVSGAQSDTVWFPLNASRSLDSTDLKDGITLRNGVTDISTSPVGTYSDGGLGWEANLQYGVDENTLTLLSSTIGDASATEPITYSCTIGPLRSWHVKQIPVGSQITVTSSVLGLSANGKRISGITLTIAQDEQGNPMPGFWFARLELDYPLRAPTAVRGSGGQGTYLGALSTYTTWTSTVVTEDDPAIPVGEFETVTCQLVDDRGDPVPIVGVSITWSVLQEDRSTVHPDYDTYEDDDTTTTTTSLTDISGQAHIRVKRTADTIGETHSVKAEPT